MRGERRVLHDAARGEGTKSGVWCFSTDRVQTSDLRALRPCTTRSRLDSNRPFPLSAFRSNKTARRPLLSLGCDDGCTFPLLALRPLSTSGESSAALSLFWRAGESHLSQATPRVTSSSSLYITLYGTSPIIPGDDPTCQTVRRRSIWTRPLATRCASCLKAGLDYCVPLQNHSCQAV
jgi:hypothetical protein